MRIECPHCQSLFEALSASLRDKQVRFACSKCEASISLPLSSSLSSSLSGGTSESEAASVSEAAEEQASGEACPKCSARVASGAKSCGACGLAVSLFEEFQSESDQDHRLNDAWQQLCEEWESPEAHESFIKKVALFGDYRAAATLYREKATEPAMADRSKEMLERIQTMATAALMSTRPKDSETNKSPKKIIVALLSVAIVGLFVGIFYLLARG